ncbi:MAG: sugar kinase [Candidatus Lokiarchaeota archaeon]|nr:sugar kinase [Candidatus Lokiarchaeota archaeon]
MTVFEKIVIITKKTWLEELIERFNTKAQAKFYIEHMGGSFKDYQDAHDQYYLSLEKLKKSIPPKVKYQVIEKEFIPNFLFGPSDLVIVIGQDGLVINVAKYLDNQLILAVNPDPKRFDGVLLPFNSEDVHEYIDLIQNNKTEIAHITMIKAKLNDGQSIYAVNDLFVGHYSHGSARYTIDYNRQKEDQSSSGIIFSTGAGSTAWFRSIITGAYGITHKKKSNIGIQTPGEHEYKFPWDANYIYFAVREPFISKTSGANIIFGPIYEGDDITIISNMPESGIIFSDGIWQDYIKFNSGAIAKIGVASKKANLILKKS